MSGPPPLRFAIVGTGALGGLYGARLHHAGYPVEFLVRSDLAEIRSQGLRVDSPWGDLHLREVAASDDPRAMRPADVVCVCWKTTANDQLATVLPPLLHAESLILLLQNGLGAEQEVAARFPAHAVAGGLAFLCSNKVGPGHIHHLDFGTLLLAALDPRHRPRLEAVAAALRAGDVPVDIADDLAAARWHKLVWNLPYNGLSTVLDCDTRSLMQTPALREQIATIMDEVSTAAAACGHPLDPDLPRVMLERTDRMQPYLPSMLLDRRRGRPLEIEYLYRRPLAAAEAAGCAMPRTALLAGQLDCLAERG